MATSSHIFISYSHRDRPWLDRLRKSLEVHFPEGVSAWDDTCIPAGAQWSDEIGGALDGAVAAVLLLSPDFLSSPFIMKEEWPRLKTAATDRGLIILPVPIRPSGVYATDIGRYQALGDPASAISLLPDAEQDLAIERVSEKIRDRLGGKTPYRAVPDRRRRSGAVVGDLPELRSFDVMPDVVACAADDAGRIWATNGEEVKVLPIHQERFAYWALPARRWKTFLGSIWCGGLVMSDWEGNIYRFDESGRDAVFHRARHDSVPIHILAAGPGNELVAAAWDGSVQRWNADGSSAGAPIALHVLPVHVAPLPAGEVLVADQSHRVHLFDANGCEMWTWQSDAPLTAVWAADRHGSRAVVAIAGRERVIRIDVAHGSTQEQRLAAPFVSFSRRNLEGDEWLVVAEENGAVEWLSLAPLQLIRGSSVQLRWPLRQIVATETQLPSALGVTDDGGLVLIRERAVHRFENVKGVQRLLLAGGGRFLLLLSDRRIGLYRNPALPVTSCRVAISGVSGTLAVGEKRRLTVTVTNSGPVPIHHLTAVVHAGSIIDPTENDRAVPLPVLPGGEATLSFSLLARVAGEVTLKLGLTLADEGGPPGAAQEIAFYAESR